MENPFIFTELPLVIIHRIMAYTGKIYYYNGKYIGKIDKNKIEKCVLNHIPKPIQISNNKYNLYLIHPTSSVGYILHYTFDSIQSVTCLQLILYKNKISKTVEWYVIPNKNTKWRRVTSLASIRTDETFV